jgi:hypothetical protein
MPAGGAGGIADVDARAALRADRAVAWLRFLLGFGSGFCLGYGLGYGSICRICRLVYGAAIENEPAMGAR